MKANGMKIKDMEKEFIYFKMEISKLQYFSFLKI